MPADENSYSLRLYAGEIIEDFLEESLQNDSVEINTSQEYIFNQIKLEQGNYSTDYIVNSTDLIQEFQKQEENLNQQYFTIMDETGRSIQLAKEELKGFISNLEETVVDLENGISQNTSNIIVNNNQIEIINNHFRVITDQSSYGNAPFLELIVDPASNDENMIQMRLKNDKLIFYRTNNASEILDTIPEQQILAYFGGYKMYIKQADILETIRIGTQDNGFLVITTSNTEGVAFTWETI